MRPDRETVRNEAGGPDDRLLTWDRVKPIAGISRTTAWRMQKTGDFPDPVPISPKRVGWWESELNAWKASRRSAGRGQGLAPPRAPRLIETARSAGPAPPLPRAEPAPATRAVEPAIVETPGIPAPPGRTLRVVQPSLDLAPAVPPAPPVRARARKRAVSPDQIDFGF